MVPARIDLGSLPLTRTGKVARRPLARRPMPTRPVRDHDSENNTTDGPLIDRRDTLLVAVAKIWSRVLGAPVETSSAHFAELGGDSLAALRVCQELSLLARNDRDDSETVSSSFAGEAMGSLGPLELLKRQRLHDYVAYLRVAVPEWPGISV